MAKSPSPKSSANKTEAVRRKLATPTDIDSNQVSDIRTALNGLLADAYGIYFKTKNFHWHVSGPNFRDYHLMFDAQATGLLATTELLSERVTRKSDGTGKGVAVRVDSGSRRK